MTAQSKMVVCGLYQAAIVSVSIEDLEKRMPLSLEVNLFLKNPLSGIYQKVLLSSVMQDRLS